ncbi:MAG: PHP domain-containing protein [Syntrophaceticus schinkii]
MTAGLSEKFKEVILNKKCLFHLHTSYTDGKCTVNDYCKWAVDHAFEVLIFTEHIRKNPSYDFNTFLADIEKARICYPGLDIWAGVEAKVLPGGELDIAPEVASRVPLICFACHSFPKDRELYQKSLQNLFSSPEWRDKIRVWVHPGRFLKKAGLLSGSFSLLHNLAAAAIRQGVLVEVNLRENLLSDSLMRLIPVQLLIRGFDAHSLADLDECCTWAVPAIKAT